MADTSFLSLLSHPENALLEFKREWHDLSGRAGKAEFAKDVLAMANAVAEGEVAHIIFGIDDQKAGGTVLGVVDPPEEEQVQQVLSAYTDPVPDCSMVSAPDPASGARLDALIVRWSRFQPHHSVRDYNNTLSSQVAYTRRGPTVGVLSLQELEQLIRKKHERIGPIAEDTGLRAGFVLLLTRKYREGSLLRFRSASIRRRKSIGRSPPLPVRGGGWVTRSTGL